MQNRNFSFITGQAKGYIEIILLKLRIIGFSNKRSGLFTRLGEAVYRHRGERDDKSLGADTLRLVGEIEAAEREILEAEKAINQMKVKMNAAWSELKTPPQETREAPPKEPVAQENPPPEEAKNDATIIKLHPDEPQKTEAHPETSEKSA